MGSNMRNRVKGFVPTVNVDRAAQRACYRKGAVALALLLAACSGPPPDPLACDDFRVMTYYAAASDFWVEWASWSGPETQRVCVVGERKIERGQGMDGKPKPSATE